MRTFRLIALLFAIAGIAPSLASAQEWDQP
jgi:hypothetical protein